MKTKYIVIEHNGIPMPVVFSELLVHSDVAGGLNRLGQVVSAGFCHRENDVWVCHGESVSLNLKSRPELDARIFASLEM